MKWMKPDPERPDILCACGDQWPSIHVFVYGDDPEACRPFLDAIEYERVKTWHRVCGLKVMSAVKCLDCPHVLVGGKKINGVPRVEGSPAQRSIVMRNTRRR